MSFILDALKKSESDRQRQNAPDISDVPMAAVKSSTPRWMLLLVALLAVNLLVLAVVLFKPSTVVTQAPVQSAVTVPEIVSKPAAQSTQMAAELRPASRGEVPGPARPDDRPVNMRPEPERVVSIPTVQRAAPAITETRLTFNDLRLAGDLNLPDLNIDIHVYSETPPDRFVFINMNQYRENATLTEGPLLREITTEGVVLEYGGATFLLPKN